MDGIQVKKNSVTSTSTASARRRPRGFGQMSSVVTDLMNLFIAFSSIDYRCDGRNSNFERKKKEEKEDKKNSRTRTTKGRDRSGERPVREKKAKKIGKFLRKKCGSESTREREKTGEFGRLENRIAGQKRKREWAETEIKTVRGQVVVLKNPIPTSYLVFVFSILLFFFTFFRFFFRKPGVSR